MSSMNMKLAAVALLTACLCAVAVQGANVQQNALSDQDVDLFSKFFRRISGAEEALQAQHGYYRGRVEELERRSNALGGGLGLLIVICLITWALTAYAWWRLRELRRNRAATGVPMMSAPMMSTPVMSVAAPQVIPSGPRLVSQKIIGTAPAGFQTSPMRVA